MAVQTDWYICKSLRIVVYPIMFYNLDIQYADNMSVE